MLTVAPRHDRDIAPLTAVTVTSKALEIHRCIACGPRPSIQEIAATVEKRIFAKYGTPRILISHHSKKELREPNKHTPRRQPRK